MNKKSNSNFSTFTPEIFPKDLNNSHVYLYILRVPGATEFKTKSLIKALLLLPISSTDKEVPARPSIPSFSNTGTEFDDNTEVLIVGEADTEVVDGGEEILSFKHVEGTEVLDMAEAEEATNAEAEAVLLEKAKSDFLFTSKSFLKSPLKALVEAESSEG